MTKSRGIRKPRLPDPEGAIVALVLPAGTAGITVKAVMAATGLSKSHTLKLLLKIAAYGTIESHARVAGQEMLWGPPGIFAHHERLRQAKADRHQKHKATRRVGSSDPDEDSPSDYFTHTWLDAHAAPRVQIQRPVSVFHLGAP